MVRNSDFYASLLWVLVGLGFLWGGIKLGVGVLNKPGPGFLPIVIGGVLCLLSIALFIATLSAKQLPKQESFWKGEKSWKRVLASLLSLILYIIFLDYLGYIITTFLLFIYLLKLLGKKGWVASIVIAILASLLSYLLFNVAMEVRLPKGLLNIKMN